MITFRRYLRHLALNFFMSYEKAAIYRTDFLLRIIRAILELVSTVIIINALFQSATSLGQWQKSEVMLIASLTLLIVSLTMLFFGNGLEGLYRQILNGTLDQQLLQPLDTQWLVSTNYIYVTNIFRVVVNTGFFFYVLTQMNQIFSWWSIIKFGICFISALIIYYGLMFMVSTISFWSMSGELFYLFNSFTAVSRYPLDIFGRGIVLVLTIFPVIFISTVPVSALLGRPTLLIYSSPVVAILVLYLTRRFWLFALKYYNSASS